MEKTMTYNCEIKEQAAQPILSRRTRLTMQELPQFLGQTYGAVMQYLGELREEPAGPPFAIYYNFDMNDLDIEAGFPVSKEYPAGYGLVSCEFPAGKMATCLHIGPYEQLKNAYDALSEWIKTRGYEPLGPTIEFYLNGPETPPDKLQTLIAFPLKSN
ncbi:MAG TPA: GyrI-like domain-containing protein [Chloroflexia bacterium]|nr:GyrI-like domain-containing protein [Chloroflexia bacterium]